MRALVIALVVTALVALAALALAPLDRQAAETERHASGPAPAADALQQGDPSSDGGRDGQDGADPQDGAGQQDEASEQDDGSDQQGLEDVDPSATPSGQALDARLDAYLDASFPETRLPGAAVAVVDASGTVYERTLGDVSSADAPMLVGSLSKSFTAVCVMQLVERGLVDLDAPAASYLGNPSNLPPSVTVRSLLNQTSGLGYYDSEAQALARTEPGESAGSFSYANANYDLLGRVVEDVSGEPYALYLRDHVLAPLGMGRSSADADATLADGTPLAQALAPGHRNWFGAFVADGFRHPEGPDAWGSAPSGYVASSLGDLERYLEMYLGKGAVPGTAGAQRVLDATSVDQMFLSRVPDPTGDTYYGMGWTSFSWDNDELVLSHDGSVEGYCARMVLLPDRGVGIVMLTDASDEIAGSSLFFEMADGVVQTVAGDTPDPVEGSWYVDAHAGDDVVYVVAVAACTLAVLWVGRWRRYLVRIGVGERGWRGLSLAGRLGTCARLLPWPVLVGFVLARPDAWGVPWRDLLTFVPDVSLVLVVCAALLAAALVRRVAMLALVARRHSRPA